MWAGQAIELEDWSAFTPALLRELAAIGHDGLIAIRNFQLVTCDVDAEMRPVGETDRLGLVLRTGTDRDSASAMWNAEGHDYRHDLSPSGKSAGEIIYAYVAEVSEAGYRVHYLPDGEPEDWDLTEGLSSSCWQVSMGN